MAPQLNQILAFTGIAPGATAALAHNINDNGTPLVPDNIFRDNGAFDIISCTATLCTVKNNGGASGDCNVWLNKRHSIDRAYGDRSVLNLSPLPFVPATGGSSGSGWISGVGSPYAAQVPADIGTFYKQLNTSIVWYKYGANNYNWRPYSCDPQDGYIGPQTLRDVETSGIQATNQVGGATFTLNTGLAGRINIGLATVTATGTPDRSRYFWVGGGNPVNGIVPAGGEIHMFTSLAFGTISDGVDNFSLRTLGLDNLASADATNGVYLENDFQVHGNNHWFLKAADNGVRTTVDLGAASTPVNNTFQKLGVVIAADGLSAVAMVNDTILGTINTNLPSAGRGFALMQQFIKTLGANARTEMLDYGYCAVLCNATR